LENQPTTNVGRVHLIFTLSSWQCNSVADKYQVWVGDLGIQGQNRFDGDAISPGNAG
jgi:hypothetical protein